MTDQGVRLKGVYGRPLSKLSGTKVDVSLEQLRRAADIIIECIREEIKKDTAKATGLRQPSEPVPIPKTERFAKSFTYRIRGKSTIEITSDWPTAKAHTTPSSEIDPETKRAKPSAPMEMWWLTRPAVPLARIVRANGEVIVRTTPVHGVGDVWIHPGYRKYTFLERGLKRGREKAMTLLAPEIVQALLQNNDLFG